jgi:hypothetical protein
MKKYVVLVCVMLVFISFYACTHKPQGAIDGVAVVKANNTNNTDTTTDVIDTSVCFQRDVLPIFIAYCAKSGCHNAASDEKGYNLTTYNTIIAKGLVKGNSSASKLYTECTSGKMPKAPTPKLDSTQLILISRWINKGAPNDTDCPVNCDTTKYTYAAAIVPILNNYCYGCHATAVATGSGGGIILDTYSALLIQAQNGKLLGDLQHATGYNQMPLGGAQLSECKITQVSKWIQAGAQNN